MTGTIIVTRHGVAIPAERLARRRRLSSAAGLGAVLLIATAVPTGERIAGAVAPLTGLIKAEVGRAPAATPAEAPLANELAAYTPFDQSLATPEAGPPPTAGSVEAINAGIPIVGGLNPAAAPFRMAGLSLVDRGRALTCLAQAVYYEAASESVDGQRAVAQVVLNRVSHPAYPATVCGVVFQNAERWRACQFTFACDGALARTPSAAGWARARVIAGQALAGHVHTPVGRATHYHTQYVAPRWAFVIPKVARVGAHSFYRLAGVGGQRHAGFEPLRFGRVAPPAGWMPPVAAVAVAGSTLPIGLPAVPAPLPVAKVAARAETQVLVPQGHDPRHEQHVASDLPESTIRPEYAGSGQVRAEFLGQ